MSSLDAGLSAPLALDAGTESLPPHVITLAAVAPAAFAELTNEAVLVLIDREGLAQLEACPDGASAWACEALRSALAASRFEPARIAGRARAARIRLRFESAPDAGSASTTVGLLELDAGATADASRAPPTAQEPPSEYGATARVLQPKPGATTISLEQLREVPGAFGDPFRVLEALPGVVPVLSGLPYVYVRGAPPAATAYVYDDIQLPTLFHFALGPGVVHPAMIGAVDFYPGVAPARYGRKTGGTLAGRGSENAPRAGTHGELELRPVDLQAYVSHSSASGARVELGGRYGYPGPLARLFSKNVALQYWDYQLRASMPVGLRNELSLVWLGSYDLVGHYDNKKLKRDIELQFHRIEARAVTRQRHVTLGGALGAGFERSGLDEDIDFSIVRLGPKLWLQSPLGKARLRIGADLLTSLGRIKEDNSSYTWTDAAGVEHVETQEGELSRFQDPRYARSRSRSVAGAYVELSWPLGERWSVDAGLRGDVWLTAGDLQAALEPRLQLRHLTTDTLTLHASGGLAYQPAAFPIALPGIADAVLQRGLQRAIQTELGAGIELPASLTAELKLYTNVYDDLLTFDSLDDDGGGARDVARTSSVSSGMELMLRRAYSERFSGWLAYTLGKAMAHTSDGHRLAPNWDVRHVVNLVTQFRISRRWHFSLRGYVQSGRFPLGAGGSEDPRESARLPPFFRGDLQFARIWKKSWGDLRFTFDWLNFTFQKEPLGWECYQVPDTAKKCKVEYVGFPITLPMFGVRGSY